MSLILRILLLTAAVGLLGARGVGPPQINQLDQHEDDDAIIMDDDEDEEDEPNADEDGDSDEVSE